MAILNCQTSISELLSFKPEYSPIWLLRFIFSRGKVLGFAFFSMCCDNKPVEFYKLMLLVKLLPLLLVNSFVTGFRNDLGKGAKLWPPHIVILPKSVKQSPKQSIATKQKQKTRSKYQRILTHETFLTFLDLYYFKLSKW